MQHITIDGRRIGPGEPPYVIAELSANHGGDIERARRIIRMAAAQGADAIKLQAYTPESMTIDCDMPGFVITGESLWTGRGLFELYAEAQTPYEWFPELFAVARAAGITPFATPFDRGAVRMLAALDAPAYKIASFEATDPDLLAACAETGKPVIVSTGLCSAEEMAEIVRVARAAGVRELALLRCNSAYPADPAEANLLTIPDMAARFDVPVGYSDHTTDSIQAVVAVALGACIVEKHVIDSREPPTPDSAFSSLPEQLGELVRNCRAAHLARGGVAYGPFRKESGSLAFRRSLYVVADVAAGAPLSAENVRSIRPGHGLAPKHLPEVLGRRARRALRRGEPLAWDMIE